jgi:hypothetical protein
MVAIAIYDEISGRHLLGEFLEEFRIARANLTALDCFCRDNPNRSDAVVAMTTLPSRLPMIADVLKSLLRQTRAPAEIRLYVPRFSTREQRAYLVPDWLRRLRSVRIIEVDRDEGPATKYLTAMRTLPADGKLIVVDDDRIYRDDMIEILDAAATAHPDAGYGLGGWIVPPDLKDRRTTIAMHLAGCPPAQIRPYRIAAPKPIDILMGCHAYLVRPRFFDLDRLGNYAGAPREAFLADDIWLSAHCTVPKFVLPVRRGDFQPYRHMLAYDRSSVGWANRVGPPDQWISTIMLQHFGPGPWLTGRGQAPARR